MTVCERCGDDVEDVKRIVCSGRMWGKFCYDCHDILAAVATGEIDVEKARHRTERAMQQLFDDHTDVELTLQHIHAALGGEYDDLYPNDLVTDGGRNSNQSGLSRTPLAGRNRLTCEQCDDPLEEDELARIVRWGLWDDTKQHFQRRPQHEAYCESCWREYFQRDPAAHLEPRSGDHLWSILEAADGDLVADLKAILVGGRVWVRVVDGELQAMRSTTEARYDGDEPVITFGTEPAEVDREWLLDLIQEEEHLPDDAYPTLVLLRPVDETPFRDWRELHADQTTLGGETT